VTADVSSEFRVSGLKLHLLKLETRNLKLVPWARALQRAIGEFLYGMTGYEFAHEANRLRHDLGTLMMLMTFGDMIGLPVLPPYYGLRLLPHVAPEIDRWKRQLLREKAALENEEYDLIEM
jgi:hypothetical protein